MTFDEARQLVEQRLDEISRRTGVEVVTTDDWTSDEGWCWVFGYNSRAFRDTRRTSHALVGNGPFVVEKATGEIHRLVTGRPIDVQLEELRPS